ncbi:hypothetical protein N9470_02980 [Emcibacteraceae bacterium]|jgi:hypothetical protein|nr:hypothetical protein [Emcibacteraceae bacterium]
MPPYQDSITALMGAPTTSDEERMAMSLRNDRTAGNLLGLSTIDQVSNLGTGMTKNTMVAAKQAGALNQAREKAALDREQRAETQAATNDYRNSMLAQAQARADALEKNRALQEQNRLRDDAEKAAKNAADLQIKKQRLTINSRENNHVFNNLSGTLGQNAAILRANLDAGVSADTDPNALPPETKVAEWAASNSENEGFNAQLTKDVGNLSTLVGLPMADAVIDGGKESYKWMKYIYDITGGEDGGRTGVIPFTQKGKSIPTRAMTVYDTSSKALEVMINQMDGYEPDFANISNVPYANPALNYVATRGGIGSSDRKQEAAWWGNLNQFYTMPERHEMFGGALTKPEIASWNASALNSNMDDYQIRHAMATRLHIMRNFANKKIAEGLAEGYSQETLRSKYKFLTDSTTGSVNPDTPEGERLLRAGWYPGDNPADFPPDAKENSETGTDTSIFTDEDEAELNALKAKMPRKVL